ncbi:MAG: DUF3298 domain-containing protein [Candidatus Paceibacterota bacterium]
MKKNNNKIIIIILVLLVVLAGVVWFYFNGSKLPLSINNNQGGGNITNSITNQEIREESDIFSIDANYPVTGQDYIDAEIKRIIDAQIAEFKKNVSGENQPITDSNYKNSFNIGYSSEKAFETVLGFKFDIEEYTGGAHGNLFFTTVSFDLANKRELALSDLFTANSNFLQRISDISIEKLSQSEFADTQWISEGASPALANFKNFIVTDSSIIFYFPPYQVAPYAAGPQSAEILLTEIKDILNPEIFRNIEESPANADEGIALDVLKIGDFVSSPLTITGKVTGNGWIGFEGQAGRVILNDSAGNLLASSSLATTSEWTQVPTSFRAVLTFVAPEQGTLGSLIFSNENPSGDPTKDKKFILPVKFK